MESRFSRINVTIVSPLEQNVLKNWDNYVVQAASCEVFEKKSNLIVLFYISGDELKFNKNLREGWKERWFFITGGHESFFTVIYDRKRNRVVSTMLN